MFKAFVAMLMLVNETKVLQILIKAQAWLCDESEISSCNFRNLFLTDSCKKTLTARKKGYRCLLKLSK